MRAHEFITEKEKLDEILPLITGAARVAGGVASGVGALARGASAVVGGVARGAGAVARGVGKGVGAVSKTVGIGGSSSIGEPMGQADQTQEPKDAGQRAAMDRVKDQMVKPGSEINMATPGPGGPQAFKVTSMQGDNVEIENPKPAPGEPKKVVYNKNDIKKSMTI
jgi:hypothetical protein